MLYGPSFRGTVNADNEASRVASQDPVLPAGKDFVADNLFDGRKLRMLTVVDLHARVPGHQRGSKLDEKMQ